MRYSIEKPFGAYKGIEFFVDDISIKVEYIEDQLDVLKSAIANGISFSEGRGELRIGWMTLDLVRTEANYLQIREPDFIHFPIEAVNSLNKTFLHFEKQTRIAKQLGLIEHFDLPTIEQSCLVCDVYHVSSYEMKRLEPDGVDDSGWYIGCLDADHNHNDPANLRRISLYEASLQQPSLIEFVGLPTGTQLMVISEILRSVTYYDRKI